MTALASLPERAAAVADDVLFPAALDVDRSDLVPVSHLDVLAERGLYGAAGPAASGGGGADVLTLSRVFETLAGGCLTTTFVWGQHQGALRRLAAGAPSLVPLDALCRGDRRAGVALGGCLPGPPVFGAERDGDGYRLTGRSPWVSGWGLVDTLLVAARCGDDLVWGVTDSVPGPTLRVEPQRMAAANASGTVTAHFDGHRLPADRVGWVQPFAEFGEQDRRGLGLNGFLGAGVAHRCIRLLGDAPVAGGLAEELDAARRGLDDGGAESLPAARARMSELAVRAATTLLVHDGSRSILTDGQAQRLAREAMFCCVFASRPAIKEALVETLTLRGG